MRSMTAVSHLLAAGAALTALTLSGPAQSQMANMSKGKAKPAAATSSDKAAITSAMSAAPMAVSKDATIARMGPDGQMRVIRKGTNAFTCVPDDPSSPGPDPMCFDKNAGEFMQAMMAHKPPPQKTGFMYMLAGGTDASNTDPYAGKPTGKNHWIKTGPHVMIVGDTSLLAGYPASPDPNTAAPYVMWAGTPYAHLMVPVK